MYSEWLPLQFVTIQMGESVTLLDFSWVNTPCWGQRSCVHTEHSTRSASGGLAAVERMDGLTGPESTWAQQSECDRRLHYPLTPSSSQSRFVDVTVPRLSRFAHVLSAHWAIGLRGRKGTKFSGAWKWKRVISLRGTSEWSGVTRHLLCGFLPAHQRALTVACTRERDHS